MTRPAFTLIELIVVMILIGIVAGTVAPRMAGMSRRRAQAEAQDVADLLQSAAQRQGVSRRGCAIDWDEERGTLLLTTRSATVRRRSVTRSEVFEEDLLTRPVYLNDLAIEDITLDSASPASDDAWRIVFEPGGQRPEVRLTLRGDAAATESLRWLITVPPMGTRVALERLAEGARATATTTEPYLDLDALGMGEQPW